MEPISSMTSVRNQIGGLSELLRETHSQISITNPRGYTDSSNGNLTQKSIINEEFESDLHLRKARKRLIDKLMIEKKDRESIRRRENRSTIEKRVKVK